MEAAISAIGVVLFLIFYLFLFGVCIVLYVLEGIGLMKMAKSCGLRNPWMGFVPFANVYLLGKLAEQNVKPGKKSLPWRHIALVGQIVLLVLALAMVIWMIGDLTAEAIAGDGTYAEYDVISIFGSMLGFLSVITVISTAYSIAIYIIYWKIYSLFAPDLAVVFLVLTILFGVTPILIFLLRNRQPVNRPGPSNEFWV